VPRTKIICFPFAGGGPSAFRSWNQFTEPDLEVLAPPLAGRERLVDRAPPSTVQEAVDAVVPEVIARINQEPVVIFGHCFGALLAYELTRYLEACCDGRVLRLFISGSAGPWTRPAQRATGLPDAEFLARVEDIAGYRHPALEHPEMRDLIMPALRADIAISEAYQPASDYRLRAPITVIRGKNDRFVSAAKCKDWALAASSGFEYIEVPGSHMYITDSAQLIVELIRSALARVVRS
jgi:surfactin synthase thioesterase subunit